MTPTTQSAFITTGSPFSTKGLPFWWLLGEALPPVVVRKETAEPVMVCFMLL